MRTTAALCLAAMLCMPASAANYPQHPLIRAGLVCVSESGISCFQQRTMMRQWSALSGSHTFDPVAAPGLVLVGGTSGLHALSTATGERAWRWYRGDDVFPPAVSSNKVYATDRAGRIAAIEAGSGRVLWQRRLDGWLYTPALVGDLVVTGGRGGQLYALRRDSGDIAWHRELDQELVHRPVALGNSVVVTTFRGTSARVSGSGEVLWQQRDPSPSFSPVPAGGLLVFGGMDGRWRARDARTGRLRWTLSMSGKLSLAPRVHGDRVALSSPDGDAAVVDAASGQVLWQVAVPGKPLGAPVPAGGGTWRVFYARSGIISWTDASFD